VKVTNQRVSTFRRQELPYGWALATLGDVVDVDGVFTDGDWVERRDQDPNGDVRLIQLADVGDGSYRDRSNRYLTHAKALELGCTFLEPNDVLIARMPDPLGRSCIFPGDPKRCVTAVDICIVRTGTRGADHRWLIYAINSPAVRTAVASLQSGSTRKRISRRNLARIQLPVPPLAEQRRIVAKIEELLTQLDAGVAALEKGKSQLRRYRQVVLKAAVEGELTRKWREAHQGELEAASVLFERILEERRGRWEARQLERMRAKGKEPKDYRWKSRYRHLSPSDIGDLPELPEGWLWARLGQVTEIHSGYGFPKKYQGNLQGEIPFYKVGDISRAVLAGNMHLKDAENYVSPDVCEELRARPLAAGTVVFAKIGEAIRLNRRAILTRDSLVDNNVMGIYSFCEQLSRLYVLYFLQTIELGGYSRATTVPSVRKTDVQQIPIPLPPLTEQQCIVEEVEQRLSVAGEMEKAVQQSLKRAQRLRHSILKRGFEGRLVPQDLSDEPASVLLERIKAKKAKREAETKATKGKRKKKTPQ